MQIIMLQNAKCATSANGILYIRIKGNEAPNDAPNDVSVD